MVSLTPLRDGHAPPANAKRKAREDLEGCSCHFYDRINICFSVEHSSRRKSLLPL